MKAFRQGSQIMLRWNNKKLGAFTHAGSPGPTYVGVWMATTDGQYDATAVFVNFRITRPGKGGGICGNPPDRWKAVKTGDLFKSK
ncbi:MAG TPA: hypothetical protein PLV53_10735 [Anaerolineaceae bacterium]|nr:hypothetical protein [Anaerolineaceae bacterium]